MDGYYSTTSLRRFQLLQYGLYTLATILLTLRGLLLHYQSKHWLFINPVYQSRQTRRRYHWSYQRSRFSYVACSKIEIIWNLGVHNRLTYRGIKADTQLVNSMHYSFFACFIFRTTAVDHLIILRVHFPSLDIRWIFASIAYNCHQ